MTQPKGSNLRVMSGREECGRLLLAGLCRAYLRLKHSRTWRLACGGGGLRARPFGGSGFRDRACGFLLCRLSLIESLDDARYLSPRLVVRRHTIKLLDSLRPCIVGSQRLDQIEVVALQQFPQIFRSALNIRFGIESVWNAESRRCPGHQLHQALRSLGRHSARIESAL